MIMQYAVVTPQRTVRPKFGGPAQVRRRLSLSHAVATIAYRSRTLCVTIRFHRSDLLKVPCEMCVYAIVSNRARAVTTPSDPPKSTPSMVDRVRSTARRIAVHLVNTGSDLLGDDVVGRQLRRYLLNGAGADIPRSSHVHGGTYFSRPGNLRLGRRCLVSRRCYLDLDGPVTLEDDVVLGHGVVVVTSVHRMGPATRRAGRVESAEPVLIGGGAWIGANAILLPGVRIGQGAVVAAGSVVRVDVPPNVVVAGVPARVVRSLADGDEAESGRTVLVQRSTTAARSRHIRR
jgi:acetyltransferase-like isoleucine patch superfamily enzyme